jgi:hypothetical protein
MKSGVLEDIMFSKATRAPVHLEIVYSGEHFTWREDETVTAHRQRDRRRRILMGCLAIALTAIVLGQSFGVAWLLTAAANTSTAPR